MKFLDSLRRNRALAGAQAAIEAHLKRAFAAREEGSFDEAIAELRRALELDPNDAFVHYNLASTYAESGERMEQAIEGWRRAIQLRPDYIEPHFDLGQYLFYNERYDEAMPHFEAIVRRRQDWPAPYYLMAVIHVKRGEFEQALAYLKTVVLINPGWAKTAEKDENFAPLRGNPEFQSLIAVDARVRLDDISRHVLTTEDLMRDREASKDWRPSSTGEEPDDDLEKETDEPARSR